MDRVVLNSNPDPDADSYTEVVVDGGRVVEIVVDVDVVVGN